MAHYKKDAGFRLSCLYFSLVLMTFISIMIYKINIGFPNIITGNTISLIFNDILFIIMVSVASLLIGVGELAIVVLFMGLFEATINFVKKMNDLGVHEEYGSLTKLVEKEESE